MRGSIGIVEKNMETTSVLGFRVLGFFGFFGMQSKGWGSDLRFQSLSCAFPRLLGCFCAWM